MEKSKHKKVVITYGTYDLLHPGHIRLLERAKSLGDYLIVFVSTDEFNEAKGKKAVGSYEERAEVVAALRAVDEVRPETHWTQKPDDIQHSKACVLVMGDDWMGKFDHYATPDCKVVYLPRTEGISSTEVKARVK